MAPIVWMMVSIVLVSMLTATYFSSHCFTDTLWIFMNVTIRWEGSLKNRAPQYVVYSGFLKKPADRRKNLENNPFGIAI
jgi:hypothetical protein